MISPLQLKLIHQAKRCINYDDADYRTVLRNIGGLTGDEPTSKDLTQSGFEKVMAFFESVGFVDTYHGAGYWQGKANQASRGQVTDRQIRMIDSLVDQIREHQPMFGLAQFVRRMTNHRTSDHTALWAREAHNLIEALKAIVERQPHAEATELFPGATQRQPKPAVPVTITAAEMAQAIADELPI